MTVASYRRPNFPTRLPGTPYKGDIDGMSRTFERHALWFAAHEQTVGSPAPDLTVRVEPGHLWDGATLTEVPAQTVSGFTVPSAGQHRIDRIAINPSTGLAERFAGIAATGSPSATPPDISWNYLPVCQVLITSSHTSITNSMITDERVFKNPFTVAGAGFPNVRCRRISGLTGAVDGTQGVLSVWVRIDSGDGSPVSSAMVLLQGLTGLNSLSLSRSTTPFFNLTVGRVGTSNDNVNVRTANHYNSATPYRHILASWDTGSPAVAHLYINDVSDMVVTELQPGSNDYTASQWAIGNSLGGSRLDGAVAELYLKFNAYLAFSVEANRRKFISATGKPVPLGPNGMLPGLGQPDIYMRLRKGEDASQFLINRGSGGDFHVLNEGSPTNELTRASTSPSD